MMHSRPHFGSKFTRPDGSTKNQFVLYSSKIEVMPASPLKITVDNQSTYTISKFAAIMNSSDKTTNSHKPSDPCFNHFARYGLILNTHRCEDMASAEDNSGSDPGALAIESSMRRRNPRFEFFNALQTQCSNSQWP